MMEVVGKEDFSTKAVVLEAGELKILAAVSWKSRSSL